MRTSPLFLVACLAAAACSDTPSRSSVPAAPDLALQGAELAQPAVAASPVASNDYSFVFLETGPATGLSQEETAAASAGHRANIERLAEEGVLLVAGPFGEPRTEESWRGIFIFDEADPARAREYAAGDPAVQAGVFRMRVLPWRSGSALRQMRQLTQARKQAGEPFAIATYVLGQCSPASAAREALQPLLGEGLVLFHGELGADESGLGADTLLFALDSESVEEMEDRLTGLAPDLPWQLSLWYAGDTVRRAAAEAHKN